ncbi:MAG: hypothetical protein RJQ01_06520 [Microcella sp.]|uniref:hypothetical protein n=1 Tax=Microcella sp. TaxID=1913979 RepID=UPI003315A544
MVTVTADAAAVMAQIVAAIVFVAILELRRGYAAQTFWELRFLAGALFATGFAIAGGILLELITITAKGGFTYEPGPTIEVWIAIRFLLPLLVFLAAEYLRRAGDEHAGREKRESPTMKWAWKELFEAMKRTQRSRS